MCWGYMYSLTPRTLRKRRPYSSATLKHRTYPPLPTAILLIAGVVGLFASRRSTGNLMRR